MARILLVGGRYLSRFLVPRLRSAGHEVVATSRNASRFGEIEALGATPATLDLGRIETSTAFSSPYDAVVYAAAAGRGGDRDLVFRKGPFEVLDRTQHSGLSRFVLTSSIGVYSESQGGIVGESTPPKTREEKADLLAGELLLYTTEAPVTVLRLGGLYGPGRSPIGWMGDAAKRQRISRSNGDGFLNWIRVEDAANAVIQCLEASEPAPLYVTVDDEPVQRKNFYELACALGSHDQLEFSKTGPLGKQCTNELIKTHLGLRLHYPTFREGLAELA